MSAVSWNLKVIITNPFSGNLFKGDHEPFQTAQVSENALSGKLSDKLGIDRTDEKLTRHKALMWQGGGPGVKTAMTAESQNGQVLLLKYFCHLRQSIG